MQWTKQVLNKLVMEIDVTALSMFFGGLQKYAERIVTERSSWTPTMLGGAFQLPTPPAEWTRPSRNGEETVDDAVLSGMLTEVWGIAKVGFFGVWQVFYFFPEHARVLIYCGFLDFR